jgi:hypothetical protein
MQELEKLANIESRLGLSAISELDGLTEPSLLVTHLEITRFWAIAIWRTPRGSLLGPRHRSGVWSPAPKGAWSEMIKQMAGKTTGQEKAA